MNEGDLKRLGLAISRLRRVAPADSPAERADPALADFQHKNLRYRWAAVLALVFRQISVKNSHFAQLGAPDVAFKTIRKRTRKDMGVVRILYHDNSQGFSTISLLLAMNKSGDIIWEWHGSASVGGRINADVPIERQFSELLIRFCELLADETVPGCSGSPETFPPFAPQLAAAE